MRVFKVLFLALFLVSCNVTPSSIKVTVQSPNLQKVENTMYPVPTGSTNKGQLYPVPVQSTEQLSIPIKTIDPSLGSVKGVIHENGKPIANLDLYLAKTLNNSSGKEIAASFDRSSSPRAVTNEEGEFVFYNVPAGKYGLVLDRVIESYLLLDPKTNQQLRVEAQNKQQADMGILNFDELPKAP